MALTVQLSEDVILRTIDVADAAAAAIAAVKNRDHLAPFNPIRPEEFFTVGWQQAEIASRCADFEAGRAIPLVLESDGLVVGRVSLSGIVRGAMQSGVLSYWIDADFTGRGLMTAAVDVLLGEARDTLGLHRVEASTLVENLSSQAVLAKCGFEKIGYAPDYLNIAGRWQGHNLFQRIFHSEILIGSN